MKISFSSTKPGKNDAIIVATYENNDLLSSAKDLDKKTDGLLTQIQKSGSFEGKKGTLFHSLAPEKSDATHIILVGLGDAAKVEDKDLEALGSKLVTKLNNLKCKKAVFMVDAVKGHKTPDVAAHLAMGALLNSYRFDKYRTKEGKDKKPTLKQFEFNLKDSATAKKLFGPMEHIAEGVFLTRDLVSEPANILYPDSFAKIAKSELTKLGVSVQIIGEPQMKKLGMGALLAVGQGSERESKLVIMKYEGMPKSASAEAKKPIAFVGKGITFDTGGISLKPGAGMGEMKFDMGGAGTVVGLMKALAGRKARVNAIGVIALAENMPSHNAYRPGDVLTSMSGQTIEVLNTDAEGRLVLCDALTYTQKKLKPKAIVDLATLTGAIIIALGNEYAGAFTNNDDLVGKIKKAGEITGEEIWHMPLCPAYDKMLNSPIADMQNIGGREAGSATAASFLKRFIEDDLPWVHLDIAGMAWTKKSKPGIPAGASGYGVRLLSQMVADYYEN